MSNRGFAPIVLLIATGITALATLVATHIIKISSASQSQPSSTSSTILVKFKTGISKDKITEIHSQEKTKTKRSIDKLGVQIVELPQGATPSELVDQFKKLPEVEYAEENYLAKATFIPNDPDYSSQWNLAKIDAPSAWDKQQASAGPVAVLDTGIDATHPDLNGEVISGFNYISGDTNTADDNGHGTHVSGIIEAVTNNGTGIASIGYHGTLLPVKVLDSSGSGTYGDIASGIVYATDHGAKVINMSLAGSSSSQTLTDAVNYAKNHGVLPVAAAGNNGNSTPVYPAAIPGVLAVSASTSSDTLASFSNYGSDIFVAAPGTNILSTYKGSYTQLSGTSMAAPHLAGLLALALSSPNQSGLSVTSAVCQTADKVGPYAYNQSGWNQYFGCGRINAGKLFALLSGQTPVASPTPTPTPTPTLKIHGKGKANKADNTSSGAPTLIPETTQQQQQPIPTDSILQNLEKAPDKAIEALENAFSHKKSK